MLAIGCYVSKPISKIVRSSGCSFPKVWYNRFSSPHMIHDWVIGDWYMRDSLLMIGRSLLQQPCLRAE